MTWTALVYQLTDGLVLTEVPLAVAPTWSRVLDGPGGNAIQTPLGGRGCLSQSMVTTLLQGRRYGLALVWVESGQPFVAGPVQAYQFDDSTRMLTLGFGDTWTLLGRRAVLNSAWSSAATAVTDTTADLLYANNSLHDIAIGLVQNTLSRGALNVDVPALDAGTGNVLSFYGYENADTATRLNAVTQTADQTTGVAGPDVDFAPYFSDSNHIRVAMLVGSPLAQPSAALVFDYGSTLLYVNPSGDMSKIANEVIVKGSGADRTTLFAYQQNAAAIASGDPLLDYQDNANTDQTVQSALNAIASTDYWHLGNSVETWAATALIAGQGYHAVSPAFGSYSPGYFAGLNLQNHPLIPGGQYNLRIQSITNSSVGDGLSFAELGFFAIAGTL